MNVHRTGCRRHDHPQIGRRDLLPASVPVSDAFTPADLAATIFEQLGIDPHAEFYDTLGRPYRIDLNEPIRLLVG